MTDAVLVLTTLPTADAAAQIAKAVVGEKLAACANILPALRSIYRWEGKIQDENEVLVLLKTQKTHLARLTARKARSRAKIPYSRQPRACRAPSLPASHRRRRARP